MTCQTSPEKGWIFLDHTADVRMEVRGDDLGRLFVNAAKGLMDVMWSEGTLQPEVRSEVSIESEASDELLVDWLREILFVSGTRGLVLMDAEFGKLTETSLTAVLRWGRCPAGCEPELEVKGVTYHGLSVEKTDTGYVARIVFDV